MDVTELATNGCSIVVTTAKGDKRFSVDKQ